MKSCHSQNIKAWLPWATNQKWVRKLLFSRFFRKIFGTIGPKYMIYETDGCQFYCDLLEHTGVAHYFLKNDHYEPYITEIIKQNIDPMGDVLDIGANIGYYSILSADKTKGQVYSIEPEPKTFEMLKSNIELNQLKNVVPLNFAANNKDEEIDFYVNSKNRGDHRCSKMSDNLLEVIRIKTKRIDNILSREEFNKIRLIKIDVQGFELKAFKGMETYLREAKNLKVISEFEQSMLIDSGCRPEEYLELIRFLGFRMFIIDEEGFALNSATIGQILEWSKTHKVSNLFFEK